MTPAVEISEYPVQTVPASCIPGSVRILFLIDEIGGLDGGGTERQVLQLIRLSKRLGYDPHLAVLRGTESLTEERVGCPIYRAGVDSFLHPSGWRALYRLKNWMRDGKFSLVQTFFVECNVLGPWLARWTGIPVAIGSRRNLNQWQKRKGWKVALIRRMQRLSNQSVDCIVGNSERVIDAVLETERAPRAITRVAYNGIDLNRFAGLEAKRAAARRRIGAAPDEIVVGNISCLRPVKGVDRFVEVARMVLEQDPRLRFLIVGSGPQEAEIIAQIERYGLTDRIYRAGAQVDVVPYLAAMDIGVLSSTAEGFSNSLLEYMACGLGIAATDVGGNREALGDCGLLVPVNDLQALANAVLTLRSAPERRRLGEAARRRVERFSLDQAEDTMEQLYAELLANKGITPGRN